MTTKQGFGLGALLFALVLGTITFFSSFYINEEYERAIVTRMGEFSDTTGPGFHWKAPFIDSVHQANTQMKQIDYANTQVATQDGQIIGVDLTINHRIRPDSNENLVILFEQFGEMFNYDSTLLERMSLDRLKSVIGGIPMEEFQTERDNIRLETLRRVSEEAREYGIDVIDLQISNVYFSDAYKSRLDDVARDRAAAASAKQQERRKEYEANGQIEESRGRAESMKLMADATAYERLENARANAEAIRLEGEANAVAMRLQNEVLRESSGLVEYTIAQAMGKWDGSVPTFMSGSSENGGSSIFPFMNLNELQK